MSTQEETRPPLPPFTLETAHKKVKAAQDAWNTRNPEVVQFAYTPDSIWRNRDTFLRGREEIVPFLRAKWEREDGYRLRKELFAFTENKVFCFIYSLSPSLSLSHPYTLSSVVLFLPSHVGWRRITGKLCCDNSFFFFICFFVI